MTVWNCDICNKTFKYEYLLKRHNKKKKPCKENTSIHTADIRFTDIDNRIEETKKDLYDTKLALEELNEKINSQNIQEQQIKCKYCSKYFNFRTNYTKHLKVCKNKNDNISIYERELGIEPKDLDVPYCVYCNKKYENKSSLSKHYLRGCRERDLYESEIRDRVLENRKTAAAHITNNNTNNTIIINMPQMRAFGNENVDYMTTKLLIKELESYKQLQTTDIGNIVSKFTQLMHANPAHPENHNVLFKSLNSGYARIYNGKNFEDRQSTEVQNEIISRVGPMLGKVCDESSLENENEIITDTLDDIDYRMNDMILDGKDNRQLSRCRNAVKAALHTHSIAIENTQQLI